MRQPVKKDEFKQYLSEARSWETDKTKAYARSRKVAWMVAIGSAIVSCLAVTSTALIAMKDPPPPTVVRVDQSTGVVDLLSTIRDRQTNYNETVNKYFVQWYIKFREGYSKQLAPEYYYNVGLMSSEGEQQKYFTSFDPANPQSPLNIYGEHGTVKIMIKGTTFIKENIALVRYAKEAMTPGDQIPTVSHWTATITFRYSGLPMSEKDRAINPLGFQVTEYRNDPDSLVTKRRPIIAPAATPPIDVTQLPSTPSAAPSVPAIRP